MIYSLSFPFLLSYLLHLPFLSSLPLLTSRPPYLPHFLPFLFSLPLLTSHPPYLPTFFSSYSLSPPVLPIFLTFSANAHPFVAWRIVLLLSLPNQHPPSLPFLSILLPYYPALSSHLKTLFIYPPSPTLNFLKLTLSLLKLTFFLTLSLLELTL